ncbi:hypothetical protein [uncultured Jannaschia sp.]|uniref:hypothetical protein n=1 Tax=uncultured Jannaschia sp. TaxID=293347 RepID=UPI00262EEE31|nr:hypothetical protein [uncultured Jannaschia sp.]
MLSRILRRRPRGLALVLGGTGLAVVVLGIVLVGGFLDLGVGGAPQVRIDTPATAQVAKR